MGLYLTYRGLVLNLDQLHRLGKFHFPSIYQSVFFQRLNEAFPNLPRLSEYFVDFQTKIEERKVFCLWGILLFLSFVSQRQSVTGIYMKCHFKFCYQNASYYLGQKAWTLIDMKYQGLENENFFRLQKILMELNCFESFLTFQLEHNRTFLLAFSVPG